MPVESLRSRPLATAVGFLALSAATFLSLYGWLGDGAFIVCNLLPLAFAALCGMRSGVAFAIVHLVVSLGIGRAVGLDLAQFFPRGLIASLVVVVLSGAIGRISDLTSSLRRELEERRRDQRELQQHRLRLESLVEERTQELLQSNEQLRRKIAEHEKAEAEKRQLAASLKRAEKMETVGLLAGSVAHDLNNTLSCLVAYPELLLLDLPEDSPIRPELVAIDTSARRAAAIVEDLLTMARRGITTRELFNLNAVVSELMASPELQELKARHRDVRIEAALTPALPDTLGSAVHLSRAAMNLVRNSVEAMEKGGRVSLSTANAFVDGTSSAYEPMTQGEYVTLAVEDDGVGIAPEDLDRIFEPFYTKKAMGRSGTGLGMAIVWGTVKDHGGFVDVHSEPGSGTKITLFLPATQVRRRVPPPVLRLEEHLGHGESILVVDDEGMQRDLCTAILTKLGYWASAVGRGEEAVEHVRHSPVDLVVLDMIMGSGIDGLETYRRILEIRPGQKALVVSGFSETEHVRQAKALGAGAYLRKPYTLEAMAVAVWNEIHGRRP